MRLIDADALKAEFCKNCKWKEITEDCRYCPMSKKIDESPTIDPTIHAQWIELEDGWLQCSNCKHCSGDTYDEWLPVDAELSKVIGVPEGTMYQRLVRPRYCGYCGAKMDKDDNTKSNLDNEGDNNATN